MMTNIPDLSFKIDGDLIRLEQNDGSGNVDAITLHRIHLRHLAEECGLRSSTERALLRLWGKLSLLTADCYLDEIVERCGDGLLHQTHAYDARAILSGILEDLGIEGPNEEAARAPSNEISPRNDKSGVSVTQSGRGRPSTGTAMTNAERQARHRAKQADLLPTSEPA